MGKDINHIEEKDELAVAQQQQRMTESYRETSRNLSGKHEQSEITPHKYLFDILYQQLYMHVDCKKWPNSKTIFDFKLLKQKQEFWYQLKKKFLKTISAISEGVPTKKNRQKLKAYYLHLNYNKVVYSRTS